MDRWLIVKAIKSMHYFSPNFYIDQLNPYLEPFHNKDVNSCPAGLPCWVNWSQWRPCVQREQLYRNHSYVCRWVGWIVNVAKNTPTSLALSPPVEFPFHLQGTAVARNNIMWLKHMLRLIYTHKAAALWTHPGHRILSKIGTLGIERWGMRRHAEDLSVCILPYWMFDAEKKPFCLSPPTPGHFCSALALVVWLLSYFGVCLFAYGLHRIMCHQVT